MFAALTMLACSVALALSGMPLCAGLDMLGGLGMLALTVIELTTSDE